jgi:hypothetical protein
VDWQVNVGKVFQATPMVRSRFFPTRHSIDGMLVANCQEDFVLIVLFLKKKETFYKSFMVFNFIVLNQFYRPTILSPNIFSPSC